MPEFGGPDFPNGVSEGHGLGHEGQPQAPPEAPPAAPLRPGQAADRRTNSYQQQQSDQFPEEQAEQGAARQTGGARPHPQKEFPEREDGQQHDGLTHVAHDAGTPAGEGNRLDLDLDHLGVEEGRSEALVVADSALVPDIGADVDDAGAFGRVGELDERDQLAAQQPALDVCGPGGVLVRGPHAAADLDRAGHPARDHRAAGARQVGAHPHLDPAAGRRGRRVLELELELGLVAHAQGGREDATLVHAHECAQQQPQPVLDRHLPHFLDPQRALGRVRALAGQHHLVVLGGQRLEHQHQHLQARLGPHAARQTRGLLADLTPDAVQPLLDREPQPGRPGHLAGPGRHPQRQPPHQRVLLRVRHLPRRQEQNRLQHRLQPPRGRPRGVQLALVSLHTRHPHLN